MGDRYIDPEIIRGCLKARDDLLFWLTEQNAPSRELTAPLWKAYEMMNSGLADIMRVAGFDELRDWLKYEK